MPNYLKDLSEEQYQAVLKANVFTASNGEQCPKCRTDFICRMTHQSKIIEIFGDGEVGIFWAFLSGFFVAACLFGGFLGSGY